MSLVQTYQDTIAPKLIQEFNLKSSMAVPKIKKVVINMGIGQAKDSRDEQEKIVAEMSQIAGQKPNIRHARLAIAGFGIRKGQPVGVAVTLRRQKMYDFLQKLFNIVLPRLRDFRGVSRSSFDVMGNYTLGIAEHTVFPEIDLGRINKVRSLEVTIVTSTTDKLKATRLLEELGMPFVKEGDTNK